MKELIIRIFFGFKKVLLFKIAFYSGIIAIVFVVISQKTGTDTNSMLENMQNFLNIIAAKTSNSFNHILQYFK